MEKKKGKRTEAKTFPTDEERLEMAEDILRDNGVADEDVRSVLQAVGYVLFDRDVYPPPDVSDRHTENGVVLDGRVVEIVSDPHTERWEFSVRDGFGGTETWITA